MSLSYAHEKLGIAIEAMAVSPASIQQRIADAYMFNIIHIDTDQDLPPELHSLYDEISGLMTSEEAEADEGLVMATVNKMPIDTAVEIARKILTLANQVEVALSVRDEDSRG